jgi:hypothetical protein
MNTPTKLGLYGVGLVVAFTGALGVGRLAGPPPAPAEHRSGAEHAGSAAAGGSGHDAAAAAVPGGLQVSDGGYRLVPVTAGLSTGAAADFRFRILGPDGRPVDRYTPTHSKDLHLIVVRRDLAGFQHVHPTLAPDGTWTIPLNVAEAGQYRVFADFQPAGRDRALTLGADVPAAGHYQPRPLPAAARTAQVDGYRVELAGDLVPGTASKLTLRISHGGTPVTDLQPYLAAYGHLVALRDGDLAYLHVHPDGSPGDGRTAAGPDITFYAEVPSAGAYRLYLDFQHNGTVRTAEFTAIAGAAAGQPVTRPGQRSGPQPPGPGGHDDQPHGHG